MIYIFHNNQLISTEKKLPMSYNFPSHSYCFNSFTKEWWVKGDRAYLRPCKYKHVPKELKMICVLLNIK